MKSLIYLFCLILLSISLNAQYSECDSQFYQPMFKAEIPNQFCELNTGMPLEILLSYLVLDSVCSYADYNNWEQFLNNQTSLNDTMKTIMKYFYNLVDYNPILFYSNIGYIFQDFKIHPLSIYSDFRTKIEELSDNPMLDEAILFSHYIFRIHTLDIINVVDLNSVRGVSLTSVKCEIKDLIKGKIGPNTNFVNQVNANNNSLQFELSDSLIVLDTGSTFEFAYSPEWQVGTFYDDLQTNQNRIVDSTGNSWIKQDNDYIVFLEYAGFCGDSTYRYISPRPIGIESLTFTMYPIKSDGSVYNPGNDFGLGNINYIDFVNAIRNRIMEIKNYGK